MANLKEKIKDLPDKPGVYIFKDQTGKILYIGKATSLKDRVRSYFANDIGEVRSPLISKMVSEAQKIEIKETGSVLEALLLENSLIKKFQPVFNIKEKDNKSYNHIVITNEDFPRVLVVRGRELDSSFLTPNTKNQKAIFESEPSSLKANSIKQKAIFGPFPHGSQLREALKIIRKIFPWRDSCKPDQGKPCFNYQIGLCPGVCIGRISKNDYGKIIKNLIIFLEGNKKLLVKNLEKEMQTFAKEQKFEEANKAKKTIFALNHIQDIALIKRKNKSSSLDTRIESYDIAHISGTDVVGVMTVVSGGEPQKSEYRKFKISKEANNDTAGLREVLERRLAHNEWPMPKIFVVDGGKQQKNTFEKILEKYEIKIPVVAVVKNEFHKPREILGDGKLVAEYELDIVLANSEAHRFALAFHRQLRGKIK